MPLKKAVRENRYEVAEFLIESGMRPDAEKDAELLYSALENRSMPMLSEWNTIHPRKFLATFLERCSRANPGQGYPSRVLWLPYVSVYQSSGD